MAAMLSEVRRITKAVDGATASPLLSCCGSIGGSKYLCCSVAIIRREVAHNIDNTIAQHALVTNQLRRIATNGKFAKRLEDLAGGVLGRHRPILGCAVRMLPQDPAKEIEYYRGKDTDMIANSLIYLKFVNSIPSKRYAVVKTERARAIVKTPQGAVGTTVDNPSENSYTCAAKHFRKQYRWPHNTFKRIRLSNDAKKFRSFT